MGMGIHGEWQTYNDSRTIRECHSPNGKGNDHHCPQMTVSEKGLRVSPPDPRVEGRDSRLFFDFLGSRVDFFWEFTARGGSGVQEGDGVWPRAGVLRHVNYITPLVIPYQSAGARERTPRPKSNRACTPPLSPLPGSFSRPYCRELGTRV